jgi:protein-L-isoaspartate(D-aspartate) O-methyltransferase
MSATRDPAAGGGATLSALHAYLLNYTLLDLRQGDRLIEVGSGTGYGAAIAARIVGPRGRVTTFEIDPALAAQARRNLARRRTVRVLCGDGLRPARLPRFNKALFTCAIRQVPRICLARLPEQGRLLAPLLVGEAGDDQALTLFTRIEGRLVTTRHGPVRYVQATPCTPK